MMHAVHEKSSLTFIYKMNKACAGYLKHDTKWQQTFPPFCDKQRFFWELAFPGETQRSGFYDPIKTTPR